MLGLLRMENYREYKGLLCPGILVKAICPIEALAQAEVKTVVDEEVAMVEKGSGLSKEYAGLGPGGYCVCPDCGYRIKHQRGMPCTSLKCPSCNTPLKREE
jgi:hypothetical protein